MAIIFEPWKPAFFIMIWSQAEQVHIYNSIMQSTPAAQQHLAQTVNYAQVIIGIIFRIIIIIINTSNVITIIVANNAIITPAILSQTVNYAQVIIGGAIIQTASSVGPPSS